MITAALRSGSGCDEIVAVLVKAFPDREADGKRKCLFGFRPARTARRRRPARKQRIDAAITAVDGDILNAVLLPRHRLTLDARAGLELPQLLAAIRVAGSPSPAR
jgi:hypothetical protein